MPVKIQTEDFDISQEVKVLRANQPQVGAVAVFVGTVRDRNDGDTVTALTLEHYPGMTEKTLEEIIVKAKARWDIDDALIIHRVGPLQIEDQIVLVAVISAHRQEAFSACEYLMDYLKTQAPFWKKEAVPSGQRWVDARETDEQALKKWLD